MYKLSISPFAKQDIQEIVTYYDTINKKITNTFLVDLEKCFSQITQSPLSFQKRLGSIRGLFLKSLSIGVYYKLYQKNIIVIAVLHTSRNPTLWKKR